MSNSKVVNINSTAQFRTILSQNEYVIVDFHAVWCGPCKVISPIFEQLASQNAQPGSVVFVKVDVDQQTEVASMYGISAMPTFLVIKSGNVTQTVRGANPPALTAAVQNAVSDAKKSAPKPQAQPKAKEEEKKNTDEAGNEETVSGGYTLNHGTGWRMSLT